MRIGYVGLGKMGYQIVSKLLEAGHEVVVTDVDASAVEAASQIGAEAAADRNELVSKLGEKKIVWLMIPDKFVETEVEAFRGLLHDNDILIDGGNSLYTNTIRRSEALAQNNISYIDVGTSGGVLGLTNGFSMMIGGNKQSYESIEPLLEVLAKPSGGYRYVGPSGYGHYVKMVHNAIEYGMMQAYAEGYYLLKNGPLENINLSDAAQVWQHGSIISSSLNQLISEIFQQNPELEGIDGYVADSGEGRWTNETAASVNIAMPALEAALQIRFKSQHGETDYSTKLLAAMRNKFGGHPINKKTS